MIDLRVLIHRLFMSSPAHLEPPLSHYERLRRVVIVAQQSACNFGYFRGAYSVKDDDSPSDYDDIRARVTNNFLDVGVLEWVKLFYRREQHAWQQYIPAAQRDAFKAGLLAAVGLSESEWDAYVDSFREYRDKFIAHLDSKRVMSPPMLDIAISALAYYMQYLDDNDPFGETMEEYQFDMRRLVELSFTTAVAFMRREGLPPASCAAPA